MLRGSPQPQSAVQGSFLPYVVAGQPARRAGLRNHVTRRGVCNNQGRAGKSVGICNVIRVRTQGGLPQLQLHDCTIVSRSDESLDMIGLPSRAAAAGQGHARLLCVASATMQHA